MDGGAEEEDPVDCFVGVGWGEGGGGHFLLLLVLLMVTVGEISWM